MIKSGVDLRGLQPQMALAYTIISKCYGMYDCVITSGSDSKHGPNSLHYSGRALDIRTRHLAGQALQAIVDKVKECLGPQFDVVLESDHLHVEFDPKDKAVKPEDR